MPRLIALIILLLAAPALAEPRWSYIPGADGGGVAHDFWISTTEIAGPDGMPMQWTRPAAFAAAAQAGYRLPSFAEWRKAVYWRPIEAAFGQYPYSPLTGPTGTYEAGGVVYSLLGNRIPYGDVPPGGANTANLDNVSSVPFPVGSYPTSHTAYGLLDVGGNVNEWIDHVDPRTGEYYMLGGAYYWLSDHTALDSLLAGVHSFADVFPGGTRWVMTDPGFDALDFNALALHWQSGGAWNEGDFTGDGWVDALDLNVLSLHWIRDSPRTPQIPRVPAIPEPQTLWLVGTAVVAPAVGALRRR